MSVIISKKLQQWKKMKLTLQHRKVGKSNILKLIALRKLLVEREREGNKRMWVRPIFTQLQRHLQGDSDNLTIEMQLQD